MRSPLRPDEQPLQSYAYQVPPVPRYDSARQPQNHQTTRTNKNHLDIQKSLPKPPPPKTPLCIPPHPLRPYPTPNHKHNPRRRRLSPLLPLPTNRNRRRNPRTPHPRRTGNNKSSPLSNRPNKHPRTNSPLRRTRRIHPSRLHERPSKSTSNRSPR